MRGTPLTKPLFTPSCTAERNERIYLFRTWSGFTRDLIEVTEPPIILPSEASDSELGSAILKCLSASRVYQTWEEAEPFYKADAERRKFPDGLTELALEYGFKSRRDFFRLMDHCFVSLRDHNVKISPSVHEQLEGWSGLDKHDSQAAIVSVGEAASEIGAALRLAFSRCIRRKKF